MRIKKRIFSIVFSLALILGMMPGLTLEANAEDFSSENYTAEMIFDCQRDPGVPKNGIAERVYNLKNPYKASTGASQDLGDDYIKVESLGYYKDQADDVKQRMVDTLLYRVDPQDLDDVPVFKLVRYEANGTYKEDLSDPGCLYVLDLKENSFLFCGCGYNTYQSRSYGYFLSGTPIEDRTGWEKTFSADTVGGLVTKQSELDLQPSTVITEPVAKTGLVENGEPQELITAGSAEGGTMQYALGTDPDAGPGEDWSESVPEGTEAGTYYVWYKVVGDGAHTDIDPQGPLTVEIAAAPPAATQYTITYDLNGGELDGQTGTVTKKVDAGTVITLPEPSREGYTFDYWEGSAYKAGEEYTVNEDHTFKAVWKTAESSTDNNTDNDKSDNAGQSSGSKAVKTGDESNYMLFIFLMGVSLAGLAGMAVAAVRKR